MIRENMAISYLFGMFLGLILFGIQISLAAMNVMVAGEEPIRVCRIYYISENEPVMEVLGKQLHIPLPGTVPALAIGSEAAALMDNLKGKYMPVREELASFRAETGVYVRSALEKWLVAVTGLYQRVIKLYPELTGANNPAV